jgi:choloylglycine hydrolase
MCTAFHTKEFFGRNLDYHHSFGEQVMITPRNYPITFTNGKTVEDHSALVGMGCLIDGYPLYFDTMNEAGLAIAGLNFPNFGVYQSKKGEGTDVASFELPLWILCQCESVAQTRTLLTDTVITDEAFSQTLPPTPLHWMVADATDCLVIEPTRKGLRLYANPLGVLTNSPPFPVQMMGLRDYRHLSSRTHENHLTKTLSLAPFSHGTGAIGLPGDFSSRSRFVRGVFVKEHTLWRDDREERVGQFFHLLSAVAQPLGCVTVAEGGEEHTLYSSCCDLRRGIYYYTTYQNQAITAISPRKEELQTDRIRQIPLRRAPQIFLQE